MDIDSQSLAKLLEIYGTSLSRLDFAREVYRLSEDAEFSREATEYLFGKRHLGEQDVNN